MTVPIPRWSEDGEPWDEDSRPDPHAYDYKVRVKSREAARFRSEILHEAASPGSQHFRSLHIQERTERRRFTHAAAKTGLFVQASCILTDGLRDGRPQHILTTIRSERQWFDETQERNVGNARACLFATTFSNFRFADSNPSLPFALINSIDDYSHFSLFARKLLLPEDLIDCRFLGVGFNFQKPHKSYVHYVWHMRCEDLPEGLIVPARQESTHDLPLWADLGRIDEARKIQNAPIDSLILNYLRRPRPGVALGEGDVGFLPHPRFDTLGFRQDDPERHNRSAIGMDLLLTFQQRVHSRRIDVGAATVAEVRRRLVEFLKVAPRQFGLDLAVNESLLQGWRSAEDYLVIELRRGDATHCRFLVEISSGPTADPEDAVKARLKNAVATVKTRSQREHRERGCDAAFLLHAVTRDGSPWTLQMPECVTTNGLPAYLIRMAAGAARGEGTMRVRSVAHGLIFCRTGPTLYPDHVLVTQAEEDECPRLPGGKMDELDDGTLETPEVALRRELGEELGLSPEEIAGVEPVREACYARIAPSPSTGQMTSYEIWPYLVSLTAAGRDRIKQGCGKPPNFPHARALDQWRRTDFGFGGAYAPEVLDALTPERMERHSVNIWEGTDYRFDVALSVAGADADAALALARELERKGVHVFHYRDFQHENWGRKLQEITLEIYRQRSKLVVAFVSDAYLKGHWTLEELKATRERGADLGASLLEVQLKPGLRLPDVSDDVVFYPWNVAQVEILADDVRRKLYGAEH